MENQKKDNSLLIRLSDEDLKKLNDGWYSAVSLLGRPVTKSEYVRTCIGLAYDNFTRLERGDDE